jgi:acyl-coenzyme A thioesterase PaaI-like protein
MPDLTPLIVKARSSKIQLRWLNIILRFAIPFNRPHGFRITHIDENAISVKLPYKRANLNHIGGLHACALATLAEFSTGLLLISRLGMKSYRIILQHIEMDYHYQGKSRATAEFQIDEDWLREQVTDVLAKGDKATVACSVFIFDEQKNHLATGKVVWQIKSWKLVRTVVA